MPFIGKSPSEGKNNILLDAITCSATATYNLLKDSVAYSPVSAQSLMVSLNGVTQAPVSAYTVSGSTIVFASALTSNDVIDYIIASSAPTMNAIVHDASITSAKLASDSVTSAKIADDAVVTAAIADDAITTALIADDAVATASIADDAITSALIADDAVVQAAIADDAVDEARIQISNAGSNGQFLSKQSGNTGGLTWAAAGIDGWSSNSNNLLPASASSGIYLGVNSATAANLLDDYEEGTFTPTLFPSSGSFTSVSFNYRHGWYTKIGRQVTFKIAMNPDGSNHGSASGSLRVGGLPFACLDESSSNSSGYCSIGYSKYWNSSNPHFASVSAGNTWISLQPPSGFDGYAIANLKTSGGSWLFFGGFYYTA